YYDFEVVNNFLYLGTERQQPHSRDKTKVKFYPLIPVLLYGNKFYSIRSWALKDSDEELLALFERILRIIYGPVCEEDKRRIRYNQELYQLYQHPSNCTNCINIQTLFENFELAVCNGLEMCKGWKKMSRQENVSLQTRMDIER
uniref:Uncharacterized protein n=1 Tax=Megaselia scalaris TaxID=36166 RepID=T1GLS9_MEGSC